MALTALEWLQLDKDERERRKGELSNHESFLLRTQYSYYDGFPKSDDVSSIMPAKKEERTPEELETIDKRFLDILKQAGAVPCDMSIEEFPKGCF